MRPNRIKYRAGEVPHATVEPNRTCNGHCRCCYNLDRTSIKSLELIKEEIDKLANRRRLQAISVLGGEPTLHPQIAEIVRYIKSKGIHCQLLTNGMAFLNDGGENLLRRLQKAGIDQIILHVDRGQDHLPVELEQARAALFALMEANRIPFSLSLTLGKGDGEEIPEAARRYARYRHFDGILSVLARDPRSHGPVMEMADAYDGVWQKLGIQPCAYVPSCQSDEDVDWLVYLYFINSLDGTAVALPPLCDLAFRKIYRIIKGRQPFALVHHVFLTMFTAAGVLAGEVLMQPSKIPSRWRLIRDLLLHRSIRFHYIVIQNPPEFDSEKKQFRFCYQCPDATMRNGRLTPVCMADWISPLDGFRPPMLFPEDAIREVYRHLGELQ